MAEGKVTAEAEVKNEENVEEQARYVLHGGLAICQCGSRTSRLQVPVCHGTYMHDMPLMHYFDAGAYINIQPFGYCSCQTNPDRIAKAEEIMADVEEATSDILSGIMDGLNAIGNFVEDAWNFLTGKEEEKKDEYSEYLMQNLMIPCNPRFQIIWSDASKDLYIKGMHALTTNCTIVCTKCNQTVHIVDDGQENAMMEQQSKQDLSNWKEGDPLPEPTKANLQELERLGKTDSQLYKDMKETYDMLEDMNTQKLMCEDEKGYEEWKNTREKIVDNYKNGKTPTNANHADNQEKISEKVANKSQSKDIYYNGKLMNAEEYNEAIQPKEEKKK